VPVDKSIGSFGLMTEGIVSTQLGLPGSPVLSETLIIKRDLDLLRYTNSKLHITGVSTAESVALITAAKADGLAVSCSVTPYHLFFCDEDMVSYDTNLKVTPPLRNRSDMMALRAAVLDGTIDCIATHHFPQNWDSKTCEFEYATYGMIGLQTSFSVINSLFDGLSANRIADLFTNNARKLFSLPSNKIEVDADADFTLFTQKGVNTYTKATNKSKSANSAFFDVPLAGSVVGVYTKGKWNKN
jgi:dihydroorotase